MMQVKEQAQSKHFSNHKLEIDFEPLSQLKIQIGSQKSVSPSEENQNSYLTNRITQMVQNLADDLASKENEEYQKRKILGFLMQRELKPKILKNFRLTKNLTKKWTNQLMKILQQSKQAFALIESEKIKGLTSILKKPVPKLHDLSKALKQNDWFVSFILQTQIKNHVLLEKIYNDKKMIQKAKISLILSYPMVINGFKNPSRFLWWSWEKYEKLANYSKISEKFDNLSFDEMLKLVQQEYEQLKDRFEKNKCSKQNNITYHWLCRLKLILHQAQLKNKYKDFDTYKECIKKTKKCSITAIKQLLQVQWFNAYLRQQKIKTLILLKDILNDPNIHILNKKNLLQTYPIFVQGLDNPKSLFSWSRKTDDC